VKVEMEAVRFMASLECCTAAGVQRQREAVCSTAVKPKVRGIGNDVKEQG
jgi:hypothetical protein